MAIKKQFQNSHFDGFSAYNGWLDCWKITYSIKERRILGKAGDVSTETVTSWMENIWNMDESGCFFKALPNKGLVEKENKQRMVKNRSND